MTHYPLPNIWQFLKDSQALIMLLAGEEPCVFFPQGGGGEPKKTEAIFSVSPRGGLEEGAKGHSLLSVL